MMAQHAVVLMLAVVMVTVERNTGRVMSGEFYFLFKQAGSLLLWFLLLPYIK